MSDMQDVKFEKLSKQSLCLFRYSRVPVAFKLSNELSLSRNVFLRLGHMLFCERKKLFKSSPIHHTPEGCFLLAYTFFLVAAVTRPSLRELHIDAVFEAASTAS
jgi:hypothetical protein